MTASASSLIDVVKAGCSLWRCMLARDKCISTVFQKIPISLCCCSTDRCNIEQKQDFRQQVNVWNMQPDQNEFELIQNWTREEMVHKFHSTNLDDDLSATSRGYQNNETEEIQMP
ncbi:hypothetical protein DICVIV_00831 [Dictyocaulus viviparus]|uniref:Uncharacterized protein n=1 Tax=Dictyocaulus viviparus TaxID=29172 RepID=A0A0D8Y9T3_DICVI|nr:hypothetical protein DICVIV_00831 [Dictyocaulus viviparus]